MSDLMLFGILRMPYDMAMGDDLSRRQFYDRAQQAADEIERLQSRLRDRQNALDHAIDYGHRKDAEIERLRAGREHWYCENCGCERCIKAETALENDHE